MEKNVGKLDAIIRYAIGGVLIVLAVVLQVWWLLIPAAIAIATGALGRCGLYKLFGINTCGVKKTK
jgi:hypothetical protein